MNSPHITDASLKILFATSEALPLIKTGGLADVSGSLPAALRGHGHDIRLILPAYPAAMRRAGAVQNVATVHLPQIKEPVHILEGTLRATGCKVYMVSAHAYFDRGGNPYTDLTGNDWGDNPDRFALFCQTIALLARNQVGLHWQPDLVHCNDWQTGLAPLLLKDGEHAPASIFTIHNLSYQGVFDRVAFRRIGLRDTLWNPHGIEYHGGFSFLKSGIVFAQRVNTVSPSYANEIRMPVLGYGMDGILNQLGNRFSGIINGIDYREWNPATDPHIISHYDAEHFELKAANKQALQKDFTLPIDDQAILFGYIGRLVEQKGVDLILAVLPRLVANPRVQIVLQGSGDAALEHAMQEAAQRYPKQVAIYIGYDEGRAHRIEAGIDCFLMPSRFEPCGLNQLYSLRYGTVPVVHSTGGLADTVVDANAYNLEHGLATGFKFEHPDIDGLWYALQQTLELYMQWPDKWHRLAITGMKQDFSWDVSARRYEELYRQAMADHIK